MYSKKTLALALALGAAACLPVAVWAQEGDPIEELRAQVASLTIVTFQLQNKVNALETSNHALEGQVAASQALLADTAGKLTFVSTSADRRQIFVEGNLHIVNGTGATASQQNGLGNLIIGYDEPLVNYALYDTAGVGVEKSGPSVKTGSHNLIVGDGHSYTSYGGMVVGHNSRITQPFATVSGGAEQLASGYAASVSGGTMGLAKGSQASVAGGYYNRAFGSQASVCGGYYNSSTGGQASISGGYSNTASGAQASVSGGSGNSATFPYAVVVGGNNTARRNLSVVVGGQLNTTDGDKSVVVGGMLNNVTSVANFGVVLGGRFASSNHATSTVLGGNGAYTDKMDDYAPF